MGDRAYLAIDMKTFYASVECVKRGYDPLTTHLVVADLSRTEKTICLAVSPSLKAYGISGRARLFEVTQRVREINRQRRNLAPGHRLTGKSFFQPELEKHPDYEMEFIVATPQMTHYLEWSAGIYRIYLNYLSEEDIHVYSIDEAFLDVTAYLSYYQTSARGLAARIIRDVFRQSGITATAGIGTNLYLSKIALDLLAKHSPPDQDGVRIAQLNEEEYRRQLWDHQPLTDFWRVGRGIAGRLAENGLFTMGDIARFSMTPLGEDRLYRLFGINAELLIDHAWGWEPCTISDIKSYRPRSSSLSSGQVLSRPYPFDLAGLVLREMADALSLDLVRKHLVTDRLALMIGYDAGSPVSGGTDDGGTETDFYGRKVPRSAHGSVRLSRPTASTREIVAAAADLFDRIADRCLLVRRIGLEAGHVTGESAEEEPWVQLSLFVNQEEEDARRARERDLRAREARCQETIVMLQEKFGKNAVLKGMNLQEGGTAIARNGQIGGHRA